MSALPWHLHVAYLRHLLRHKALVWRYGRRLRVPMWRLLVHDCSRLLSSEWFAYVRRFHGGDRDAAYFAACLTHMNRNAHHWQHWVCTDDIGVETPIMMPPPLALEMVADWLAAAHVAGTNAQTWYAERRDRMVLHPETRHVVEAALVGMAH